MPILSRLFRDRPLTTGSDVAILPSWSAWLVPVFLLGGPTLRGGCRDVVPSRSRGRPRLGSSRVRKGGETAPAIAPAPAWCEESTACRCGRALMPCLASHDTHNAALRHGLSERAYDFWRFTQPHADGYPRISDSAAAPRNPIRVRTQPRHLHPGRRGGRSMAHQRQSGTVLFGSRSGSPATLMRTNVLAPAFALVTLVMGLGACDGVDGAGGCLDGRYALERGR